MLLCEPGGTNCLVLDVPDFPNGIVVRPDAGAVLVAHTLTGSVWEHDAAKDGSLSDGRLLADLSAVAPGFGPDGLCLVDDGSLVVAGNRGETMVRHLAHRGSARRAEDACWLGADQRCA